MTRAAVATLAALLLAGVLSVAIARLLGRSGSRASLLVSVLAQWLGAYAVWTFAGGLALRAGVLGVYDGTLFALLALVLGFWQYRVRVTSGPERALMVFVGGQIAWLVIVAAQNGLFAP
ncbi:MAG: hypothetical protein ACREM3_05010 [Candidatus Rokuibacteriota bacterium]